MADRLPGPAILQAMDGNTTVLLYGEAMRSGHPALQVLETVMNGDPEHMVSFQRFVRGEPGVDPASVHPQMRAAAELVRSRVPSLPASERTALRAAALKDDVLGTVVSRAVKGWPEPGR